MFSLFRLVNPSYRYFKAVIVELAAGVFLILTIGFWLPIALRLGGILLILSFIFLAVAAVASDADETNEIRSVIFLSHHPAHLSEGNIIHSIRTNEHPPQLTSVESSDQDQLLRHSRYRGFGVQTFLGANYLSCIRSSCGGAKYETNDSDQELFDRCFKNRFRNLPRWYGSNNGYADYFVSSFKDSWWAC